MYIFIISVGLMAIAFGFLWLPTHYRMKIVKDMKTKESVYIGQHSKFCIFWRSVGGMHSDPDVALSECHKHQDEVSRKFEVKYISPLKGIK